MPHYLANNLAFLRREKGLKVDEMALSLGVWEDSLRRYEMGREVPDLDTLLIIAEKLQLSLDQLLTYDLDDQRRRLRRQKIKLILLDVDGTLTDGGLYYGENGTHYRKFHVKDGLAIKRVAQLHNVRVGFISAGSAEGLIRSRAKALDVDLVYAGPRPKTKVAEEWLNALGLHWKQTVFVGDDLTDLDALGKAGFSACPSDAAAQVKAASSMVLGRKGGEGCIRELIEEVLGYNLEG